MNQPNPFSELSSLERRINLLVNQYNSLKEEVVALKEENGRLKSVITEKDEQINNFQKTIKISNIVNHAVADHQDTTELKRTINEYIKEIDRCIAHLSQ